MTAVHQWWLQGGGPVVTDLFGALVLLRFDGAVGTQDFHDSGLAETTWTPSGAGVVLDGDRGVVLPTDSAYLRTPYDESIDIGGADFTIEFFVTPSSGAIDGRDWLGVTDAVGATAAWAFYSGLAGGASPNKMTFYWKDSLGVERRLIGAVMSAGVQQHFAATREGSTMRLWQNGVKTAELTGFTDSIASTNLLYLLLGKNPDSGDSVGKAGTYGPIRIFRGQAIYTAAFTPPDPDDF